MKKNLLLFLFIFITLSAHVTLSAHAANNSGGKDSTVIIKEEDNDIDEEYKLEEMKKRWIEEMHRAAPGTDWRIIESQNMLDKYSAFISSGNKFKKSENITSVPNGLVCGNWIQRGSDNQAGRCDEIEYDSSANYLYLMGDGGSLFKGVPDSANWTALNDHLKFSNRIIKITKNASGGKRILVSIGLNIFYSDDNGTTFNPSSGISFPISWGGNYINQLESLNDAGNTLFLTTRPWDPTPWSPRFWLYKSIDHGQSWSQVFTFPYGDDNHLQMWKPYGQQNYIYALLNQDATNRSRVYKINRTTPVAKIDSSTDLPVNVDMQFAGNEIGATTIFYALANGVLYKSINFGMNWTLVASAPTGMGVLDVSILDANKIIVGGLNAYRSYNGGSSWTLMNDWSVYYGSPSTKLHADIRKIKFFKRLNGSEFLIVNCDGGSYRSDDYLTTVNNISLKSLDVGQYYDVLSDHTGGLFLGSQDQGFQRADNTIINSGILQFQQAISGDYGCMQLTRNYQTMWAQYPGGHEYYYYNSLGSYTTDWSLPGTTKPLSGWMLATAPVYPSSNNQIYLGGGNLSGGAGSYLVKLTGTSSSISATQINYDFRGASNNGIAAIGTTPLDVNRIYVAKEDGSFYYSTNAGSSWTQTSGFNGPTPLYLFASCVLASKITNNLVWYAGSGYSNPAVYKSINGGVTFTSMSNGLPSTLVFKIAANYDETLLFAATEAGPYVYSVADNYWYPLDNGIAPSQSYWSVNYDSTANVAHFATYGRGIWDYNLKNPTVSISASPVGPVCNGTSVTFNATSANGGANPMYQWKKNNANVATGDTYLSSTLIDNDNIQCVMTSNGACVIDGTFLSNSIIAHVNICTVNINLKALIEGFYIPGVDSMIAVADPINHPTICDTITLQLADSASLAIVASSKSVISTHGQGTFNFTGLIPQHRYYLVFRHRNSIETWSKYSFLFSSSSMNFDFTKP